jgi:hypothetical protein
MHNYVEMHLPTGRTGGGCSHPTPPQDFTSQNIEAKRAAQLFRTRIKFETFYVAAAPERCVWSHELDAI